jgi:hypothetical protein
MGIISRHPVPVRPAAIYPYFDKVQVWCRNPADGPTLARLRQHCGRGGLHAQNAPARFNPKFRQRLGFKQPNHHALRWIAARNDALINQVEIALDLIFADIIQKEDAWAFLNEHLVRRWHGRKQEIRVVKSGATDDYAQMGTRYDAGRWAPNSIVIYPEDYSRVTGELHSIHVEWRLKGLKAVQKAGIKSGRDLLEFSHRDFWAKRLLLYSVNPDRLGRLVRNRLDGTKSRVPKMENWSLVDLVNIDRKKGGVMIRAHDTIQELIDHRGGASRIQSALVPISVGQLLPE